jgi:hypothetical protein
MVQTRTSEETSKRKRENASNSHLSTPQKARIHQAYTDRKAINSSGLRSINHTFSASFQAQHVSKSAAYRVIQDKRPGDDDRTLHNALDRDEPRGRSRKIKPNEVHEMERYIEEADAIGRSITWLGLGR